MLGPPGTGKTYLASRLAKAMGLPMHQVQASFYNTPEKLFGTVNLWMSQYEPGLIMETLRHSKNCKNVVLFIDEVDKVLKRPKQEHSHQGDLFRAWLYNILEVGTKNVILSHLGNADVSIENLIIIMTANEDFEEEALRQRVRKVVFPGFNAGDKERMGREMALAASLSPEAWEPVLKLLVEKDQLPGVRVFRDVWGQYLQFLKGVSTFKELYGNYERTFDIEETYIRAAGL
jgi:ATP-dependent Lon protease